MDDSMSSTNYKMRKTGSSTDDNNSSEESGWTSYLEDFMANDCDFVNDSFSTCGYQSSMVSDAACSAIPNLREEDNGNHHVTAVAAAAACRNRDSTAKRRKTKATIVDHELEDTASSPSHSPKVNDLHLLYMNLKGSNNGHLNSQAYNSNNLLNEQSEVHSISCYQEKVRNLQHAREGTELGLLEKELRRKGLCMVPMSMLISYFNSNIQGQN